MVCTPVRNLKTSGFSRVRPGTLLELLAGMLGRNHEVVGGRIRTPVSVTVPAWFTVLAACKVAAAKRASDVTFYDQRGERTTLSVEQLSAIPSSRLLANCTEVVVDHCALAIAA